jgi:hypothetical protein
MAFCRFGKDSDTYVIGTVESLQCLACRITGEPDSDGIRRGLFETKSRSGMASHLLDHRKQGFNVPQTAIMRLGRESEEWGDEY